MQELDNIVSVGCQDESVKLINVSYPEIKRNMNTVIINSSVFSGIVLLALIIVLSIIITQQKGEGE
jgi:hypothetical protein